jgi:hypothetical protein
MLLWHSAAHRRTILHCCALHHHNDTTGGSAVGQWLCRAHSSSSVSARRWRSVALQLRATSQGRPCPYQTLDKGRCAVVSHLLSYCKSLNKLVEAHHADATMQL